MTSDMAQFYPYTPPAPTSASVHEHHRHEHKLRHLAASTSSGADIHTDTTTVTTRDVLVDADTILSLPSPTSPTYLPLGPNPHGNTGDPVNRNSQSQLSQPCNVQDDRAVNLSRELDIEAATGTAASTEGEAESDTTATPTAISHPAEIDNPPSRFLFVSCFVFLDINATCFVILSVLFPCFLLSRQSLTFLFFRGSPSPSFFILLIFFLNSACVHHIRRSAYWKLDLPFTLSLPTLLNNAFRGFLCCDMLSSLFFSFDDTETYLLLITSLYPCHHFINTRLCRSLGSHLPPVRRLSSMLLWCVLFLFVKFFLRFPLLRYLSPIYSPGASQSRP